MRLTALLPLTDCQRGQPEQCHGGARVFGVDRFSAGFSSPVRSLSRLGIDSALVGQVSSCGFWRAERSMWQPARFRRNPNAAWMTRRSLFISLFSVCDSLVSLTEEDFGLGNGRLCWVAGADRILLSLLSLQVSL